MHGSTLSREIWGCLLGYTLSVKYLKNHCDNKRGVLVVNMNVHVLLYADCAMPRKSQLVELINSSK